MRIALAQINSLLGDFQGNSEKIITYVQRARERRCDLVVFPEAALFGYHPNDLLECAGLVELQEQSLKRIHKALPKDIAVIVGAFVKNRSLKGKGFFNAAVFLQRGKPLQFFAKELLPAYDIFDEGRHIESGSVKNNVLTFKKKKILITVCEDIWAWPYKNRPTFSNYKKNPLLEVKPKKLDLVINISASPFTAEKLILRKTIAKQTAKHFSSSLVYVNMVGAQDELIFDGGSFAIDKTGKSLCQSVRFLEDLNVVDLATHEGGLRPLENNPQEVMRSALILGIKDFVKKNGLSRAHLGLSGGIDSALVACLAVDAIGAMNVTALLLTGPFTSKESVKWSKDLAENLGIKTFEINISTTYEKALSDFEKAVGQAEFALTNENLQSRLRGLQLMAYSNRFDSLLLGTSNKSELATGYGTLYGDLIGGLMPIGDLLKTQVFKLAKHYGDLIPNEIIQRPPSAELRANQTDQDSLPPYEDLDAAISKLVLQFSKPKSVIEQKVLSLMTKSEFKRWQAPPILKVSAHAFGRGRRFPIAHKAVY